MLQRPGLLPPDTVFHGRYRILRAIKSGGMGTIYEVLDDKTTGRRALKVMLPNLVTSETSRARFELEAKATGAIESDHLVRILDAGIDANTDLPFLVMELLRGEDLGAILDRAARLSADDVVHHLGQAALALDKLHAAGIVHRDLKPENLFVTRRDDGSTCLKILDFGIVKTQEPVAAGVVTRGLLGTPLYMAPEQVQAARDIGPPADIYALGQLAYDMLVGEPYWSVELGAAGSPILLAVDVQGGPKEPPCKRARRRTGVALPAAFDAWFSRITAPAPEERFSRATHAIAALAEIFRESREAAPAPARKSTPHDVTMDATTPPGPILDEPAPRLLAKKGFVVSIDAATNVVRVDVWGFWDVKDGQQYWEEFRRRTGSLLGKRWYVLANISNFPPQKPEVSAFVEKTMSHASAHGLVRAANLVSNALGRLQIQRLSLESGLPIYSFFTNEGEALRWLLTGK